MLNKKQIEMGNVWFDFVVSNKEYWTHGMTAKRLEKVKELVFNNEDVMSDLLVRHGAKNETPKQMQKIDNERFLHGIGNFVCNIHYEMMDARIIKG